MRFQFSILTMLLWTTVFGITLAIYISIPSLRHDLEYLTGMLPRLKRIPSPTFDEVAIRFAALAPMAIVLTLVGRTLFRTIVSFANQLWRGKKLIDKGRQIPKSDG